jgi:hypothetical protein
LRIQAAISNGASLYPHAMSAEPGGIRAALFESANQRPGPAEGPWGAGGTRGPGIGSSSGVCPGNSSGRGGSPGSCSGGGTSGRGFPGGFSCGGSDGRPGLMGGSSCGSIGISQLSSFRVGGSTARRRQCSGRFERHAVWRRLMRAEIQPRTNNVLEPVLN